jgi:site-specific DNA recombinase
MKTEIRTIKAVIICRVSSKEQEETGYSLDAQEKLLNEYADKNKISVVKVYKISESASGKQARKKFYEILQYIKKNNVSLILAEKIDRLTRNLKDASIINDWVQENKNNEVHFVKENFIVSQNTKAHENFVWDMKVAMARFYTNNLSEEVKKGQKEKIAQGWVPMRAPLGYKSQGEKGHMIQVVDSEMAPLVKKMFELYATGNYSVLSVQDEMVKLGLRTRNGNKVLQSRIYTLLQDPYYYGKIRWNGEVTQGSHEPIITKDLFDKVQSILKKRGKTALATKHDYLFKSRVFCDGCGGVLSWEKQKSFIYGHCNNHIKSRGCLKKTYIKEEDVERQIDPVFATIAPTSELVLNWLEDIIRAENAGQVKFRETEIQRLNGLLGSVRKQKDKYFEAKINKEVDLEYCERKIKESKAEESLLESALDNVVSKSDVFQELRLIIHELAFKAKKIHELANNHEKRMLFTQLFTNFSQNAYEIRPNYTLACDYLLEWVPKLNEDYERQKTLIRQGKKSTFVLSSPVLLRDQGSNLGHPRYIYPKIS